MQAPQAQTVADCLSIAVDKICEATDSIPVVGLSGPQGAGKTTALTALYQQSTKRIATLGIDDFYLTKAQRIELAKTVSPLYATRGPAGTHDIQLIDKTLESLLSAKPDTRTPLISFDKVSDDRTAENDWLVFEGKPDVIILEGWLVGAIAPDDFSDSEPINDIERSDQGSAWRRYQNNQLDTSYAKLWDSFDAFIHIQGPGFATVFDWRKQQEASNLKIAEADLPSERIKWLSEFIQHYQRLTIAMENNSHRSGAIISIDKKRAVTNFDLRLLRLRS
ncbi:MAG: D-glycerate 3-kinase [Porticoccaceae bacterium]|jgi:D-glycerate 3-kinase